MNRMAWMVVAALGFCGSMHAQEIDIDKEVAEQMAKYDTNKDGKVTKAEYRAVELKETPEGEDSVVWLDKWRSSLVDFLATDTNDDYEATSAELKAYYQNATSGTAKTMGKLSKKDVGVLDDDYLEPAVTWLLDNLDSSKNRKISKKEAEDADAEGLMEYDTNGDGSVDAKEIKETQINEIKALYEIEEGYTLKGEASTAEPEPLEIPEEVRAEFNKVDTSKDGFVDKEEMKATQTEGKDNKAYWWGMYIAFLAMDADDDLKLTVEEFTQYASDEAGGVAHKFYPKDRAEALNEIWAELDANADGKVKQDDWDKLFPGTGEFPGIDADSSGDVSKDELWDVFKGEFGKTFEFPEKDREGGTTETPTNTSGTPNPDDPMWDLYKKVGRSWTMKVSSTFMGIQNVSYMKTEVVKLEADHCVIKSTMLDKDKKEMMPGTETKIEFKTTSGGGTGTAPKVKDLGTETIKVEAGEFECKVTEVTTEAAGATYTTKAWSHSKYAGLAVKSETTSKDMSSSSELVEFKE